MGHVGSASALDVFRLLEGDEPWSLVPEAFEYASPSPSDDELLLLQAHECGRSALFELLLRHGAYPRQLLPLSHG